MSATNVRVSLFKAIERYGHLAGDRKDTEATADDLLRDFIVIPRTDLPEVDDNDGYGDYVQVSGVPGPEGFESVTIRRSSLPGALRHRARAFLAIAEFLEQRPPVDEVQVSALMALIWGHQGDAATLARHLIESGRVTVKGA